MKNISIYPLNKTQTWWSKVRSWDWREVFVITSIVFIIILFSYTAVSKIFGYEKFVFQMRLVPIPIIEEAAPIIGIALPIVELVLVVMLYKNKTRYYGCIFSLALMIFFEIYIIWMKIIEAQTGIKLPCTCGGIISKMGWNQHLIFNATCILLLFLSIRWFNKKLKTKR